jgi:hypothetical protein
MNKEIKTDLLTLIAFSIQQSKTEGDDHAVASFKESVNSFDFEKPVTASQAVGSAFDVLKDLARLSPTQADDRAIVTAEIVFRSLVPISEGEGSGKSLIDSLKELFRRRRNR